MKVVILAGGLGTRLAEETEVTPKPKIRIGSAPILWHIMKIYSHFGLNDFIVCLGYKGYVIKEYFANYVLHVSDVTIDLRGNSIETHQKSGEPWKVTLIDTGEASMTGGRLARVRQYIGDETFCFTYGDGVADVDIGALLAFHRAEGRPATVTAVRPPARFGAIHVEDNRAAAFLEKPQSDDAWISGGFFVLEPSVIDLVEGDDTIWERRPLETLAANGQLSVYRHSGFWQPMDTLRDKRVLEQLWSSGQAPWKVWE
jgi:glucose-1-phosphate cytidylyltransferase